MGESLCSAEGYTPQGVGACLAGPHQKNFPRVAMISSVTHKQRGDCIPKCNPYLQLQRIPTCYHDFGAI
jgi:hypothetical protein